MFKLIIQTFLGIAVFVCVIKQNEIIGYFTRISKTSSYVRQFYKSNHLDIDEIEENFTNKRQDWNHEAINNFLNEWQKILQTNTKLKQKKASDKSMYEFDINVDLFKNSLDALIVYAITVNELNALNRTQIILSKLKELSNDYVTLCNDWKSDTMSVVPLDIGDQLVCAPMECAWALKIIFSICPTGDSSKNIIETFHLMILAFETKNYEKALQEANKLRLEKLDIAFIAQHFGILSKIVQKWIDIKFIELN